MYKWILDMPTSSLPTMSLFIIVHVNYWLPVRYIMFAINANDMHVIDL